VKADEKKSPAFQLFGALRPLTRAGSVRDALAAFQLAAMNIPQALGYTKIAGTPVVIGFYTLLFPMLAFAAFGSSRYLVVAADSATAAILAGGLTALAPLASPRYVELASTVALLTGALLLVARLLDLGFLADFLSQTVLVGFLTGVGFQVGIAVLGEMLGIEVHAHRSVGQFLEVIGRLHRVHLLTVSISASVVVLLLVLRSIAPKIPAALIAVVGTIAASAFWDLAGHGVAIIGPVAGGLPRFAIPTLAWQDIDTLLPIAGSCFVMIVAQSAATARFYAARHHEHLEENADLVGLSAANIAASVTGTFVVDGSPTQTAMVESSGGQSQLAQVSTAVVVALVLLFFTGPLQYLPRCVLGAIVFVIAIRLIDLRGLRDILIESPGEHALAVFTAVIVVLVGVEQAIVLAMVLSLLRVLGHSYRPQTGVLIEGERGLWEAKPLTPGIVSRPGLVIYHFGASLFYANAGLFSEEVTSLTETGKVRWLIVDAEAIANVDFTAARMLRELHEHLEQAGVFLGFARLAPSLQSDLVRHRVIQARDSSCVFPRLHDALNAFASTRASKTP
jgi:SulP family sulfate permease